MDRERKATKMGAAQPPTSHLVIAGTGRAGTSFLVRYLTELGLDTTLSRRGEAGGWDDAANAGLEEALIGGGEHLPYVVKSPWIGEYIEQVLADPSIKVDALLVPVRDLVEAATSRAILEMRAIHQSEPRMAQLDRSWEVWGATAGGVVYSLNPLDQARLLAVGFHNLVWRAVEAEVPVYFLAFPRLVEDKEYLFQVLRPVLPPETTPKQAHDAHARTVDLSKVRVGSEMSATLGRDEPASVHRATRLPRTDEVDTIALRRELLRLRAELTATSERAAHEVAGLRAEVQRATGEAADLRGEMQRATGETDRFRAEAIELRAAFAAESARSERLNSELVAIRDSRTWRMAAPMRALLTAVKKVRS